MRKIITILLALCCLPMMAIEHSYTTESMLANGHWVKIRVSESGVCRMSFSELRSAGLDPNQVRVFGYGGAQKTQDFSVRNIDDLPQVPVYVGDNYILFYVQGPISWSYNSTNGRFVHTRNTYSNYGYYMLTDDQGELLAPTEAEAISGTATEVRTYPHYQVHDLDSVNLIDRGGVSGGGRTFYGEKFLINRPQTFTFATPNAVEGENNTVYIDLAAAAAVQSYFYGQLNGGIQKSVYIRQLQDHYAFGETGTLSLSGAAQADRQQVQLTLQSTASSALGWLNYIEITTPSTLKMTGDVMPIRTTANRGTATPVQFHLSDADASIQVWDITRLDAIRRMPTTLADGELTWTGTQSDGIHEYVAVRTNGSDWVKAEVMGEVKNQNLHRLNNIDYVIICPEGYESYAEQLAKAHEDKQAITWAVVTDQQVYNEFSSGTPDATAYRWLMKMLYDRANKGIGQKPRWLLLFGHGSFDNRELCRTIGGTTSGKKLLLTYQAQNSTNEVKAYASDDYFGWLDNNEGNSDIAARLDIGVGRLPINDEQEAQEMVNKLIKYMANGQKGKWKNQLAYLADDGENGQHTETAEKSAELVRVKNPDFVVHKIFLDAYPQEVNASGESYPLAKNRVLNLLKSGVLFFDYSGHGGYNAITNESILNLKDIESMSNDRQGFWLFATCNFAQFDGGRRCAAESAVLNPNGGAISILAATRTVYAAPNTELNRAVCDTLFGHSNVYHYETTLGEAITTGKNSLNDARDNGNKLAYVLLGDPALRLNYPTDYQVETLTEIDTLNALDVQHVEARIIDEDHQTVDFNGRVDITVYDKMQSIPTRDNDQVGGEQRVVDYNDYPNIIFSGATDVKNGLFDYTFMVPKDIRYNFGNGRIVYYAYDNVDGEAVGHHEAFTVGGTGSILAVDTVGPEMTIYLNSPAFMDGDKTYATPRFYAELYDEHGINTAGAGIGHDLMMVIDNDPKQTYSINEYFTAENNSYTKGMVSYLLSQLEDGPHQLSFRAWDLLNNSTTKTLNFVVEAGLDPSIYSVSTYPNPVQQSGVVTMTVLYDQPDELLSTEVCLYNVSGQMVWTHKQNNPEGIQLNLGEIGLQPGVYIYNVRLKAANSKYSHSSGKIIVTK